ncbi:MAG: hypothetical protein EU533_03380 [Promethearchaeota archaeon]|nr:MAG: hypothetical protein EU533_03380 [Candidatus Lokiarchaeota archaeon]
MELNELYITNIIKKTGFSRREIERLVEKKQNDLKEYSKMNVLYAISKEYSINVKNIYDSFQI